MDAGWAFRMLSLAAFPKLLERDRLDGRPRAEPLAQLIAIADTDKVARLRLLRALRDLTPGQTRRGPAPDSLTRSGQNRTNRRASRAPYPATRRRVDPLRDHAVDASPSRGSSR